MPAIRSRGFRERARFVAGLRCRVCGYPCIARPTSVLQSLSTHGQSAVACVGDMLHPARDMDAPPNVSEKKGRQDLAKIGRRGWRCDSSSVHASRYRIWNRVPERMRSPTELCMPMRSTRLSSLHPLIKPAQPPHTDDIPSENHHGRIWAALWTIATLDHSKHDLRVFLQTRRNDRDRPKGFEQVRVGQLGEQRDIQGIGVCRSANF